MLIKVCGMRDAENIHTVESLGVDMIGMIFVPRSPRCVSMQSSLAGILPDSASESFLADTHSPSRVGVFVDDMPQHIMACVYNFSLDYVQLHGHESRTLIENLRATIDPDIRHGVKIIKAISVAEADDLRATDEYEGAVDLFLFDTKCATAGGSGRQFDWSLLDRYHGKTPFLLSGGIGPDDVAAVRAFSHPQCVGIDVNSRFETEPGMKDVDRLRAFVEAVRA